MNTYPRGIKSALRRCASLASKAPYFGYIDLWHTPSGYEIIELLKESYVENEGNKEGYEHIYAMNTFPTDKVSASELYAQACEELGLDLKVDTLGQRIKYQCREMGMTQAWLADKMGVTQCSVEFWISGRRKPSGPALKLLAQILDVSEDWLLNGD